MAKKRDGTPPKPKLDMDKIAKQLGADEHFTLDKPIDLLNPGATLDEIRRKRGTGKKTKQPK